LILAGCSRQVPISLVLVVVFAILGWSVLPMRATGGLTLKDPTGDTDHIGVPVFALHQDGVATLFGEAMHAADGGIQVTLYDKTDPILLSATQAISLPGDLRLLWLLASEDERRQLRDMLSAMIIGASDTAFAILQSPDFASDYRPSLVDAIQSAMLAAWQGARTQKAWTELLQACEPPLREVAVREIRPIVARRFDGVPSRLLYDNLGRFIPVFGSGQWDLDAAEQAIQASIAEVRGRGIPERALQRLFMLREVRQFLQIFLATTITQLMHDPVLPTLVARLSTDTRFRPALAHIADPAAMLARTAPRLMVSLHGSTDLNLVASHVIHTMAAGRTDRVIVLMSDAQYHEIDAIDPGVARQLRLAVQ
jgi:hypothetical protein